MFSWFKKKRNETETTQEPKVITRSLTPKVQELIDKDDNIRRYKGYYWVTGPNRKALHIHKNKIEIDGELEITGIDDSAYLYANISKELKAKEKAMKEEEKLNKLAKDLGF